MAVLNQHYQTQNGKIDAAQLQYDEMAERVLGLKEDLKFMWKEFMKKVDRDINDYFVNVDPEASRALDRVPCAEGECHKRQRTDEAGMLHGNHNPSVHFSDQLENTICRDDSQETSHSSRSIQSVDRTSYTSRSMELEESNVQSHEYNRTVQPTSDSNSLPIPEASGKQRSSTPLEQKGPETVSQGFTQSFSAVRDHSSSREGAKENGVDPPPSYHSRESESTENFCPNAVYVLPEKKCDRPPVHGQEDDGSPRRGGNR